MIDIKYVEDSDKEFWYSLDKHLPEAEFDKKVRDKYGFIDDKGKMVIVLQFDEAWWNFSGGMCAVYVDDKCGLIDINGKWIFEPNCLGDACPLNEGIWQVSMDDDSDAYVDSAGSVEHH